MIHEDAIPFLVLAVLAVVAGVLGRRTGNLIVLNLFFAGGVLPLLAYASNAERWPIPSIIELSGFFSAIPLVVVGALILAKRQTNWSGRMIGFWIAAGSALCAAIYVLAMIVGRGRIPV